MSRKRARKTNGETSERRVVNRFCNSSPLMRSNSCAASPSRSRSQTSGLELMNDPAQIRRLFRRFAGPFHWSDGLDLPPLLINPNKFALRGWPPESLDQPQGPSTWLMSF
jgi:hypothetical protein